MKKNNFDEVVSSIACYLKPDVLKDEYKQFVDSGNFKIKEVDKYFELLTSIGYFYKKLIKYEVYFRDFYPTKKTITEHEALWHHINAYLEDIDIFRNKCTSFLNILKRDLKSFASNKNEIDDLYKHLVTMTEKVFKQVKEHRHPHHHKGNRFLDPDLISADGLFVILQDECGLKSKFNIDDKIVEARRQVLFEKSKQRWINTAKKNGEALDGFLDDIFGRIKNHLYQYLNIKPLEEIVKKKQLKNN